MQLAISNISFEEADAARVYALMARLGVAGLEIAPSKFIGPAPYRRSAAAAQKAAALRAQYGFSIPSMQSIWFGQTGSIFCETDAARLAAYTRRAVDFAAAVGCKSLVFGCPKNRVMPSGAQPQDAQRFFADVCAYGCAHGVVIALEANPPLYGTNFINTSAEAFAFAKSVPGLRVNYDVGTLLINGESPQVLFENLALVSHIHLSEPGLAPIAPHPVHRTLAEGLRAQRYAGSVSVEMKTSPYAQVEAALRYLAQTFA